MAEKGSGEVPSGGKPGGKEGKGKEGKGAEGKGGGGGRAAPQKPQAAQEKADFKYIVRIANTDLDGKHKVGVALSHVKGVGARTAGIVADVVGVPRTEKIGNLDDAQVEKLESVVSGLGGQLPAWLKNHRNDLDSGEDLHLYGTDLETKLRDDLNRLKKIRSYKGVRHDDGQKVRGQRSRSNGRTGLTVGVQRKAILQAQAPKKEEGRAEAKKEGKEAKEAKPAVGASAAKKPEVPKK